MVVSRALVVSDTGWLGGRAVLAGVVSGAEDLLSRLIGMRLPGAQPGYSMGLILEARGVLLFVVDVLMAIPSFYTLGFVGSLFLWGSCCRAETRPSSHDEDIYRVKH